MGNGKLIIKFNRNITYQWPGTGSVCGREGFLYRACPSLIHFVRYKNSCHRRDCRDHWRDWLKEESTSAAERIAQLKGRWQHVVLSFGDGWEPPRDTDSRRNELAKVRNILHRVGFKGGCIVLHEARAHTQAEAHTGDNGAHYHAYCVGWCHPERVARLHDELGIVIVAFGRDYKRPFKRIEYMLSHCALPYINPARIEGSTALHAITYWGVLSYNKLKMKDYEPEIWCPCCERSYPARQWHDLRLLDHPPDKASGVMDGRIFEPYVRWIE